MKENDRKGRERNTRKKEEVEIGKALIVNP